MSNERARILPPYTQRVDDIRHRATKLLLGTALIMFAILMGFVIAVFGLRGWFLPTIPLVMLAGMALWMAPDVDTRLDGAIVQGCFLFWGVILIWPDYIAINIPGLPWISFRRLTMGITAVISLMAISTSSRLRGEFVDVLTSQILMLRLFVVWVLVHALMLAVGFFESTGRWIHHTLVWHLGFILAAWVLTKPGLALRLNTMILIALAFTAAVVIPEVSQQKPIWIDYVPTFLGIDPELQDKLQFGRVRFDEYRARSIFVVSLVYAQYVGLLLPFLLLAAVSAPTVWGRSAAITLMPLVAISTYMTHARTGMVAMFVGCLSFAAIWVYRRFKTTEKNQDLFSASMLYGFPIAAMIIVSASLLSTRVRTKLIGGSGHAASTEGRGEQWDKAIPEILTNPFGHGMGSIERVVPSYNQGGEFTIDSYPINLLVEYGVIGFLAFAGFFILAVYVGLMTYFRAGNREEELAGAAAIGLFTFIITTTVMSTEINFTLAFLLAGMIVGLSYRQKKRLEVDQPVPEAQAPVRSLRLAPLPN